MSRPTRKLCKFNMMVLSPSIFFSFPSIFSKKNSRSFRSNNKNIWEVRAASFVPLKAVHKMAILLNIVWAEGTYPDLMLSNRKGGNSRVNSTPSTTLSTL